MNFPQHEVIKTIDRKPGQPALKIHVDCSHVGEVRHKFFTEILRRAGVPFDPSFADNLFPFNLRPGSKIEIEYDTHKPNLAVLRYFGPLAIPASTIDEDDEL